MKYFSIDRTYVNIDGIQYWIRLNYNGYICDVVSLTDKNTRIVNIPKYITIKDMEDKDLKIFVTGYLLKFRELVKHEYVNLEEFTVDKENNYFLSYDGILYNKHALPAIVAVPMNCQKETVTIPELPKSCGYDLTNFDFCKNIKTINITLPNDINIGRILINDSTTSYKGYIDYYTRIYTPKNIKNVIINNKFYIKG